MSQSVTDFLRKLVEVGVLNTAEAEKLIAGSSNSKESLSPKHVARSLVDKGKLTRFQASALLDGEPELLIDKYLILDIIDSGGMGVVFKAIHRSMNRIVALKMLPREWVNSPTALNRFRREVRVAGSLSHPNIVLAHDADESNGSHFLVMEYVDGFDLRSVVHQHGPMTIADAVSIVKKIAEALKYAHENNVIHRDIKPRNVMLDKTGNVKVLDMGLARFHVEEEFPSATHQNYRTSNTETASIPPDQDLTKAGQVLGTISFMAPEQASDPSLANPRTDVYSLGCTMYYLLTAEAPYHGKGPVGTLMQHLEAEIPSLSQKRNDVPRKLEAIYLKMLAKSPEDRYQSMDAVVQALLTCNLPLTERIVVQQTFANPVQQTNDRSETLTMDESKFWKTVSVSLLFIIAVALCSYGITAWSDWQGERSEDDEDIKLSEQSRDSQEVSETIGKLAPTGSAQPLYAEAPFTGEQARQLQRDWASHLGQPVVRELRLSESSHLQMNLIPPGGFTMGSSPDDKAAARSYAEANNDDWSIRNLSDEVAHRVRITQPFRMSSTEVTLGQFRIFVDETNYVTSAEKDGVGGTGFDEGKTLQGTQYSWKSDLGFEQSEQNPVVNVSWKDANAFCAWLSRRQGVTVSLPSEAQWEYACRAGTTSPWHYGTVDRMSEYSDAAPGARNPINKVAGLKPNAFGLYDMHGNAWEWCNDWYAADYYSVSPIDDPQGPSDGYHRVLRGGSCGDGSNRTRSALRNYGEIEGTRSYGVGFRIVAPIEAN